MRKIVFALVALVVACPAFGDALSVTATQVGSTLDVDITYNAPGTLPRGFGLDITVDNGQTIDAISNFMIGECTGSSKGFGIFPANFARYIDPADPNTWGDANYTPVADPCDLPGDTEDGLGTSGITIEMGSLYVAPNSPPASGTLCTITVSGGCHVSLAANVGRGKVVLEDGNEPSPLTLTGCDVITAPTCPCPGNLSSMEGFTDTVINIQDFQMLLGKLNSKYVPPDIGTMVIPEGDPIYNECGNISKYAGFTDTVINIQDFQMLLGMLNSVYVPPDIGTMTLDCPGPYGG